VIKPSEHAPAASALLSRALPSYLDRDAVAVVQGGPEVSEHLIDSGVDHVFFTGSADVGRLVAERAGRHLTPVTLELGGKSPALVGADADIDIAARRIAWGKLLNAGQSCIAPDYVIVAEEIADQFCDALVRSMRRLYGNDARTSTDFGRIVSDAHVDRLARLLDEHGGTVVLGGEIDRPARYVAPTIVRDPDPSGALMTEEIFGPILPVLTTRDLDAAVHFVSARPAPLALYIFTESRDVADRVLSATRSGTACINTTVHQFASSRLPFGGIGPSGTGRYHGRYGYETFSHLRPVLDKPSHPDPALGSPPYGALRSRVMRMVLAPRRYGSRSPR